jgi:hypothetical protein
MRSWRLTSYVKTLHGHGESWETLYWHLFAASVVLRFPDECVLALQTERYAIEDDSIRLLAQHEPVQKEDEPFSLDREGDLTCGEHGVLVRVAQ